MDDTALQTQDAKFEPVTVTKALHNIEYLRVSENKHFVSLKLVGESGVRTRDLRLSKQVALTTSPGPPHYQRDTINGIECHWRL